MDKEGKWWAVILVVILGLTIIFCFYGNSNSEVNEVKVVEKETFKTDLTLSQVTTLIPFQEVYNYITDNSSNSRNIICLNACGKQCVNLGYSYEKSAFTYYSTVNGDDEIIKEQTGDNTAGKQIWCSCECNKD